MNNLELLPYYAERDDLNFESDEYDPSTNLEFHPDVAPVLELCPWLENEREVDILSNDLNSLLLSFHYCLAKKLLLINKYLHLDVMHRGAPLLTKAQFVSRWLPMLNECMTQEQKTRALPDSFVSVRHLLWQASEGNFCNARLQSYSTQETYERIMHSHPLAFTLYLSALASAPKKELSMFQAEVLLVALEKGWVSDS